MMVGARVLLLISFADIYHHAVADGPQLVADFQSPYCMTSLNWLLISNLPTA